MDSACCLAEGSDRIALLTPCKQKHPLNLSAHINRTLFILDQGCGLETNPSCVRRQFLANTLASKLKWNIGTLKNRNILLMKFLAVLDANKLIVNTELTKIKVTVEMNLKWHNLSYPCYLAGRHI